MEKAPLKLVYHLHIPDGEIPEIYKYHFACLKEFANVFDEYDITLSVNDTNNEDLIKKWEQRFFDIGIYKNVTFNVVQNNIDYREAETFKKRIIDKLLGDKSLTFFAHGKGMTNELNDSVICWVLSMYFFNLIDINLIHFKMLQEHRRTFCGHWAYHTENLTPVKYNWVYPGSFYWINMPSLYEESLHHQLPVMHDRFYAEDFPGNCFPLKTESMLNQRVTGISEYFFDDTNPTEDFSNDFYHNYRHIISFLYKPEHLEKFDSFVDYIKENLIEFK